MLRVKSALGIVLGLFAYNPPSLCNLVITVFYKFAGEFVIHETSSENYEWFPSSFCFLFPFPQQHSVFLDMSQLPFLLNLMDTKLVYLIRNPYIYS